MKQFSVVSVDMFGTLADVDTIKEAVWRTILKDAYTAELARRYCKRASDLVFKYYDKAIQERRYVPPRVIYEQTFSDFFREIGLDHSPKEAAQTTAISHPHSEPFADTAPFLDSVGKAYPICLSSDTDEDMLGGLTQLHPFDKIFTSEELGTYKTGSGGRFFSAVISHYGVPPGRINHIGDSLSDILGAKEAGIVTCWLNRHNKTWSHDVKPDYEARSLIEAASILGVEA